RAPAPKRRHDCWPDNLPNAKPKRPIKPFFRDTLNKNRPLLSSQLTETLQPPVHFALTRRAKWQLQATRSSPKARPKHWSNYDRLPVEHISYASIWPILAHLLKVTAYTVNQVTDCICTPRSLKLLFQKGIDVFLRHHCLKSSTSHRAKAHE